MAEYLNNKAFEKTIALYRAAEVLGDKEKFAEAKEQLTKDFYLLTDNIIRAFNFKLIDRDDALQEGVLICFEKIHRFDPSRGKAFAWVSQVLINNMRALYRTAKNYHELKRKFFFHLCDKNNEQFFDDMQAKKGMQREIEF